MMGLDTSELFAGQELVDEANPEAASGQEALHQETHELVDPVSATDVEPETQEEGETGKGRKKLVPLGALQQERTRRQELDVELQRERDARRLTEERFDKLFALSQQPQQPQQVEQEEELPAFVDDPEGHLRVLTSRFEKKIAELTQGSQQVQQHTQQQAQFQQIVQRTVAQEHDFTQTTPDYPHAVEFFKNVKAAEYMAAYGCDEGTARNAVVQRDFAGLSQMCAQQGTNAAQTLYNIAKALGYKASTSQQPALKQNLGVPPKGPTSLGNLGGSADTPDDTGKLTQAKLGEMSDDEFDKLFKEMEKKSRSNPRPAF